MKFSRWILVFHNILTSVPNRGNRVIVNRISTTHGNSHVENESFGKSESLIFVSQVSAFHSRLGRHQDQKTTHIRADMKMSQANRRHNLWSASHRVLLAFTKDCQRWHSLCEKRNNWKDSGRGRVFTDKPEKCIKHCFILNISLGDYKCNLDLISGGRQETKQVLSQNIYIHFLVLFKKTSFWFIWKFQVWGTKDKLLAKGTKVMIHRFAFAYLLSLFHSTLKHFCVT